MTRRDRLLEEIETLTRPVQRVEPEPNRPAQKTPVVALLRTIPGPEWDPSLLYLRGGSWPGNAQKLPSVADHVKHPHVCREGRRVDDILVTLAGPGMNVVLAVVLMGLARLGVAVNLEPAAVFLLGMAHLSLLLCFFNLIPIPPLDGSQVMRVLIGMSYQTFAQIAQYGFIILILVLQIPPVRFALGLVTGATFHALAWFFRFPMFN